MQRPAETSCYRPNLIFRLHMLSARNNVLSNVLRPESYFYKIHATATVKWQKPWDFKMLTQTIQQKFVYVSLFYIKCFGLFRIVGDGMADLMLKLGTTSRLK
ncbi:hypothetical protein CEXT_259821 [Caerostris extrusa]|uniref:Uncharacterized protein n=1 Tax=Caerostris extrusa TaxID=172846 RepID=A0AAV4SBC8_CAEEX|nr:hypothetical protein CEXT_259821 [Caerostris extrusa]